ncbi:MAG TPA: ATP-binding protein [Acidimicrobiales bacterium]|nr:ATP-binding protein [Acidimicrobiales bacterium]
MSASSAQLQFAAEFVVFLAAASGLAVVALRGALLSEKAAGEGALTAGFLALATAAFLHGSQLVDDGGSTLIVGLRTAGIIGVLLGCLVGWVAGETARILLGVAVAFIASATFVDSGQSTTFSRVALSAGGLALGVAVLVASRRSIAARVAATAATTLLIVVLVLGVAISAVLVNTVQESAVDRIQRRAENEASSVNANEAPFRLREAKVIASALLAVIPDVLAAKVDQNSSNRLSPSLSKVSTQFLDDVSLAFVAPTGRVHGVANLSTAQVVALAGKPVVIEALNSGGVRTSIELLENDAFTVGAAPVVVPNVGLAGVAVALKRLDDTYLAQVASDDPDLSLALVKNSTVARRGDQPAPSAIAGMLRRALTEGRTSRSVVGDRFVAVAPVKQGDGTPQLALVASSPTTLVNRTRDDLFRNLFLVALGGALLALLFAVAIGARIGAGLARLRTAAEAIQGGDFTVRAGIESADEVGVLSRAFDSMAESVQEKTAAETRLRGRLEAVVAGMGEALVAVDGSNRVTDFNRAAEELIGLRQDEALGRPIDRIVRLSDSDGAPIEVTQSRGGPRWSTLGMVETVEGRLVPVAVSAGALRGPGTEAGGSVLVLADLTREREVEQMKKEFLSRIGHELRHPLVPIMGYAEILNRKEVPRDKAREMYAEMLDQSRKLERIIEMLEFFAASAAAQLSLRLEEIDPRVVIDDVVRRWQMRLGSPDLVRPRVRRTTPTVLADRRRLTKSIDELVDNAVKFSLNGGKIVVSAEPRPDGGVEISVTDHGQGMTAAEQEKAFEAFVQGDPSDTRPYGGLGLGLAFVRRVAEAHGGTLQCTSVIGKGSKFSISVPNVPKETAG